MRFGPVRELHVCPEESTENTDISMEVSNQHVSQLVVDYYYYYAMK